MKKISILAFLFCLLGAYAKGQPAQDSLPGNTALPSSQEELARMAALDKGDYPYSVEDYFAKPTKSYFQISPDGKHLSLKEKDKDGKNHVYVKNLESGKVTMIIPEKDELVQGYFWRNPSKLLFVKDKGGNENYHMYSVNIDGSGLRDLTPFEGVTLSSIDFIDKEPDYVIVALNKNNPEIFEPFKININTGEIERIYENSNLEKPVDEFILDRAGVLRAIVQKVGNTDYQVRFRRTAEEEFQEVVTYSWQDQFSVLEMHQENKDLAYVATNIGKDKTEIVLYDMTKRQQVETLFQHPDFDADDLTFSKKRNFEIDYFEYVGEKEKMIPVSPTFQKLHQTWTEKFSPNQFSVVDRTKAEDKFLLYVNSDKIYGRYYLYDVATDEFTLLMDLMPNLKEEDMAEMRPIRFKSRDGYNIHAYITLPKAVANGEKVPLIVNPHGGPYGVRDIWDFNPETQLFASRGYATLQINYRGSGGYGKKFYLAGSKQIGRKMLDDLEDGVQFVLDQGWIDKDRIAIYGGSYGGLATLGSLIKTPDLYKCGVDYVGVSNFFTFINSFPAYWKPYMEEFYAQWYDPDIPEEKKIMEEVSPALNIDKLNKPVFVVQGANDPRVNIHESDQIVEQLRAKGYEVPYMVKYNEGHGFSHEENRIELYRSMLGFFKMHLQ